MHLFVLGSTLWLTEAFTANHCQAPVIQPVSSLLTPSCINCVYVSKADNVSPIVGELASFPVEGKYFIDNLLTKNFILTTNDFEWVDLLSN